MNVSVTGISSRYFSWTSSDPHRSRFKLHTAALSVLCVLFQVQLSFVVNLSNVFPVQFPNFSLSFSLLFQWLQLLPVQSYISASTFVASLYTNTGILTSFTLPFARHYYYYYYYSCIHLEGISGSRGTAPPILISWVQRDKWSDLRLTYILPCSPG